MNLVDCLICLYWSEKFKDTGFSYLGWLFVVYFRYSLSLTESYFLAPSIKEKICSVIILIMAVFML
jgi:hypothetical protein